MPITALAIPLLAAAAAAIAQAEMPSPANAARDFRQCYGIAQDCDSLQKAGN